MDEVVNEDGPAIDVPSQNETTTRTVKLLPKSVSTKICTSQVIISAAGAVRQLLDNSIDAGAKCIEVCTVNFGVDLIRVSDDGSGIDEENFDSLCKQHATSKITEYDDLLALSTLGFRGEALNAMCSLGFVTITTRTSNKDLGYKLTFDHNGVIVKRDTVPREIGTTVEVRSLFNSLPVRRKEFERTSKRDFSKLIAVVQEFAIASPTIRFNVFSELPNGKRHNTLSTTGGSVSLDQVISDLFGCRKNSDIIELKSPEDEVSAFDESVIYRDDDVEGCAKIFRLDGFVSSPVHGNGRLTSDRQFVYINGRPVDYQKVCRTVNEIYQIHNRRQYPTLVLRITMPSEWVDVNVTPDKRLVFCQKEKALLFAIRNLINESFKPYENQIVSLEGKSTAVKKELFSQSFTSTTESPKVGVVKRKRISIDSDDEGNGEDTSMISNASEADITCQRMNNVLEQLHANDWGINRLSSPTVRQGDGDGSSNGSGNGIKIQTTVPAGFRSREMCLPQAKRSKTAPSTGLKTLESFSFKITPHVLSQEERRNTPESNAILNQTKVAISDRGNEVEEERHDEMMENDLPINNSDINHEDNLFRNENNSGTNIKVEILSQQSIKREILSQKMKDNRENGEIEKDKEEDKPIIQLFRTQQTLNVPLESIFAMRRDREESMERRREEEEKEDLEGLNDGPIERNEKKAEEELRKAIKKSDFIDMKIVGQFNNGFIITRLNNHLFIIDQHASDEKANFEKFQKSAVVKNQQTIIPQKLNVGAVYECVLRDNISIFNASGFRFKFPEDGSGALLTSLPVVHGAMFDTKDIDEMISNLSINPGVMCRPSKLTKVFASKACRSSVMIGTRLRKDKMRKIVHQLANLDHPWSCPHGRPTLRHLFNLDNISID